MTGTQIAYAFAAAALAVVIGATVAANAVLQDILLSFVASVMLFVASIA